MQCGCLTRGLKRPCQPERSDECWPCRTVLLCLDSNYVATHLTHGPHPLPSPIIIEQPACVQPFFAKILVCWAYCNTTSRGQKVLPQNRPRRGFWSLNASILYFISQRCAMVGTWQAVLAPADPEPRPHRAWSQFVDHFAKSLGMLVHSFFFDVSHQTSTTTMRSCTEVLDIK